MTISRRTTIKLGLAAGVAMTVAPFAAVANDRATDTYKTDSGEIGVTPIQHASFVLTTPGGMVIYNDPVGGAALYEGQPKPDLILITHEHPDHYDPKTLEALAGPDTRLITNPAVHDMLPDDLKQKAQALANGEATEVGDVMIDAVPAFNTTEERKKYHPLGRDNGYVLAIDGKKVYIAGDTEDIPPMRAMEDVFIAFVPMNLPYTMSVEQAADAVAAFQPTYVYPYHYRGSDIDKFAELVKQSGADTKVVKGHWYDD